MRVRSYLIATANYLGAMLMLAVLTLVGVAMAIFGQTVWDLSVQGLHAVAGFQP